MKGKYRYEFKRISKDGVPYLQMLDNYLAPVVVNEFLLKYEGVEELNGYGAQMIDLILDLLSNNSHSKPVNYIVIREPLSRVKYALDELGEAMEDYDDTTKSKSSFSFQSIPVHGDVFTVEIKNQ